MRKLHVNQKVRFCSFKEFVDARKQNPGITNFARVKEIELNVCLITLSNGEDWYIPREALMPGTINKPELE